MKPKIAFSFAVAALVALLSVSGVDAQVKSKDTATKDRRPGTTSNVGNRCAGGTYNSCVQANVRAGYSNSQAAAHCSRTCAR